MATSASPLVSPSSDQRYWSALHQRVESLLETRNSDLPSSSSTAKPTLSMRLKEDSILLIRGFDSIASSLSILTADLESALQGARDVAKPSILTETIHSISDSDGQKTVEENKQGEISGDGGKGMKRKLDDQDSSKNQGDSIKLKMKKHLGEMNQLNKVKNLAVAMASKSNSLAREIKSVKSDMCFLQERCALLVEENLRLGDGFGKGVRPDDDDLVRLQLEALLTEKSRLATENANLTRENQCLLQLVEYHQFASQDLSASYEQAIQGLCLDFSSPLANEDDLEDPKTPTTTSREEVFEDPTCFYKSLVGEQEQLA